MRYYKAGTNVVGIPKEMVFYDKNEHPHLLDTLTPKHHLASHYGTNAIELTTKKGNIVKTISKGEYVNYQKKVKKQKKAIKKAEEATQDVMNAEQKIKKRGRPAGSKNKAKIVASTSDGVPIAVEEKPKTLIERRGLAPLSYKVKGRAPKNTMTTVGYLQPQTLLERRGLEPLSLKQRGRPKKKI